ncbi:MAG: hypothetical protein JNK78_15055 [Planctomycetes bacterium]|nr:hypothetical protein [Planctomycetota bacterium]
MPKSWITALVIALALLSSDGRAQARIVAIGDSITESAAGQASYRYHLWKRFDAADQCADFVGPRSGVAAGLPAFVDFDQQHAGFTGFPAAWIGALAALGAIPMPVADVALVHVGTNDIVVPILLGQVPDLVSAEVGVQQIIATLRVGNPNVRILLAEILPIDAASPYLPNASRYVDDWNALFLPNLLALGTPASPIQLVDQHTGFVHPTHFRDAVHPNDLGEQMMADRWFAALTANNWVPTGIPCVATLAPGCSDAREREPAPRLALVNGATPVPGNSLMVRVSDIPPRSDAAALILGASEAGQPVTWSGCPIHPSCDVYFLQLPSSRGGDATFTVQLPTWTPPGLHLYVQAATMSLELANGTTSNGVQLMVF